MRMMTVINEKNSFLPTKMRKIRTDAYILKINAFQGAFRIYKSQSRRFLHAQILEDFAFSIIDFSNPQEKLVRNPRGFDYQT